MQTKSCPACNHNLYLNLITKAWEHKPKQKVDGCRYKYKPAKTLKSYL